MTLLVPGLLYLTLLGADPSSADSTPSQKSLFKSENLGSLVTDLDAAVRLAQDYLERKQVQEKQTIQQQKQDYDDHRSKQILLHLTRDSAKVFTPNRPVEDKDLLDKVLPHDELAIVCDGVDQVTVDGRKTWKCLGNVWIHASRVMIECHEARVSRDDEHIHLSVTAGRSLPSDSERWNDFDLEPTNPQGQVLFANDRDPKSPSSYGSAVLFRSGRIRLRLHDGGSLVILDDNQAAH